MRPEREKAHLRLFHDRLDLLKAKPGPEHPDTLRATNDLAVLYSQTKQFEKSAPLYAELLEFRRRTGGNDHPETLKQVVNLGVDCLLAGRPREAIPLLEEAHLASKTHPQLRGIGGPLIDAYMKAGENAKLGNILHEQLPDARRVLPKDSPQLAGLLSQIGLGLLEQKKWAEAEPLLRECLTIREKAQPEVWTTFNTQSMLGAVLFGQKKYADAEPLLLKGYEGMKAREKTIPPPAATRIPVALDRLIELYTATNKPDEVTKWRAERAKYPPGPPPVAPPPREKM